MFQVYVHVLRLQCQSINSIGMNGMHFYQQYDMNDYVNQMTQFSYTTRRETTVRTPVSDDALSSQHLRFGLPKLHRVVIVI